MAQMLDMLEMLLENLVELGILVFEFTGVGVIIGTSLVSLYKFLTRSRTRGSIWQRAWPWGWSSSWAVKSSAQ